jgi:uncharacterized protein
MAVKKATKKVSKESRTTKKPTAKKAAKPATKKPAIKVTASAKKPQKVASQKSSNAKAAAKTVTAQPKLAAKALTSVNGKKVAPPTMKKTVPEKPEKVIHEPEDQSGDNTSKIVDMIAEKKATKVKGTTEVKEKKLSAKAAKIAEKAQQEPVKERRFNFHLKTFNKDKSEFTTEERLQALFQLQLIDSEIDKIRIVRGELPMEVSDLEDEIAGLQTRIQNSSEEVDAIQNMITQKKQAIKDSNAAIKKYESQQMNVKNNREFDSLNKEIEYQQLEIQLSEKRIKEYTAELAAKSAILDASKQVIDERLQDLNAKKAELDNIIGETRKEEEQLVKFGEQAAEMIDERLLTAYHRIRQNARNGLAVVTIQRDACGGCFNKIPPQRQLDIRQHKKVIVCEHCGRILVDHDIEL